MSLPVKGECLWENIVEVVEKMLHERNQNTREMQKQGIDNRGTARDLVNSHDA